VILYGSAYYKNWDKVAVYNGNTDLNDATALCMTQKDDGNLIDRTHESQDHIDAGWMWKDGYYTTWGD